jgi:hypothetical protein
VKWFIRPIYGDIEDGILMKILIKDNNIAIVPALPCYGNKQSLQVAHQGLYDDDETVPYLD